MHKNVLIVLAAFFAASAFGQSVPAAIYTDPPAGAANPARMSVLQIPTHGVRINGIVYQPSGAGPHPTIVICHGLPGDEKNLDLAQAVRRAGWNAVTFNYRGSWGSPGDFRFSHTIEDAEAVLAYLRDPANAKKLGVDTHRIVMAGHSMGGWVVVHVAAQDRSLYGAIIFSAADMSRLADMPRERLLSFVAEDIHGLAGVTPEIMADELSGLHRKAHFEDEAAALTHTPLLALSAHEPIAPQTDALVRAIRAQGGNDVTEMHADTDHSWSDHRIALESIVITWLDKLR
ncbi:MAG TPA: alpha/beta fold hydrolase [Candidatus Acidoferrales bacterium]|nr:alpha/beta fold hydrolase [Candidatus Acidoferrales bacterium]